MKYQPRYFLEYIFGLRLMIQHQCSCSYVTLNISQSRCCHMVTITIPPSSVWSWDVVKDFTALKAYIYTCLVTYCLSSLNGIPYRRPFWYLIKHANVIDNQSFPALPLVHIAIHTWQSVPQYMLFMTYQHAVSLCMRVCFPSFNDISALRHDLGPYSICGWESSLPMQEGVTHIMFSVKGVVKYGLVKIQIISLCWLYRECPTLCILQRTKCGVKLMDGFLSPSAYILTCFYTLWQVRNWFPWY